MKNIMLKSEKKIIKNNQIEEKILKIAKSEFLEKGFINASMRTIAEKSGFTTGMLYSRFTDKDMIFTRLVSEGADKFLDHFVKMQENFESLNPDDKIHTMNDYSTEFDTLFEIIYDYFDSFKLIVCCSAGSTYENFVAKIIQIESDNTLITFHKLYEQGFIENYIREDLCQMLCTALVNGMFTAVVHDFSRKDAYEYMKSLQKFFTAGWREIIGVKSNLEKGGENEEEIKY